MVTTRRSNDSRSLTYERNSSSAGVDLLERTVSVSYDDYLTTVPAEEIKKDNTEERMRESLNQLLGYDRYSEQVLDSAPAVAPVQTVNASSDEDIRPTSTTMQFGSIGADEIHNEMRADEVVATKHVTGKGKLAIVLYSLILTVVMALVIINTGVLNGLNSSKAKAEARLNDATANYEQLVKENEALADPDRIGDIAENELGMIK
jgi:cell division protein FtsL